MITGILRKNHIDKSFSDWKVDSMFTLYSPHVSPNYRYHGAIDDIRHAEWLLRGCNIADEDQLILAKDIVSWLRSYGSGVSSNDDPIEKAIERYVVIPKKENSNGKTN
jgi:hypothetical protein